MADYLVTLEPLEDEDDWVTSRMMPDADHPAVANEPAGEAEKAAAPLPWPERLRRLFGMPGSTEDSAP